MGCLKLTYYDEGLRLRPAVLNNPVRYIDPDGREPGEDVPGLPTIDGQTAPWSLEYIEEILEISSNPTVSAIANVTDNLLQITKGMGHVATLFSVANDSYNYFVKEDIGTGRYFYRLTGAVVATTLTIAGCEAALLVGPSVLFYEKAFDYIKYTYEQIDSRLNSIQWWGGQFAY